MPTTSPEIDILTIEDTTDMPTTSPEDIIEADTKAPLFSIPNNPSSVNIPEVSSPIISPDS